MNFSERFTLLLKNKGITAYKMASDIQEISEAMIGKWKSGKSLPSFENIVLLSNYLCVSTDYLLKGTNEQFDLYKITNYENNLTTDEKNLLRLYRKTNDDGRDLIQETVSEIWAKNQRPKSKSSNTPENEITVTKQMA